MAGQLGAINEATLRAMHLAESLPYKLQEKVGEIAALVQQGEDDEKEAMAAELEELRESEERHLEATIDKSRVSLEAAVKRVEAAESALAAATAALGGQIPSRRASRAFNKVGTRSAAEENPAPR